MYAVPPNKISLMKGPSEFQLEHSKHRRKYSYKYMGTPRRLQNFQHPINYNLTPHHLQSVSSPQHNFVKNNYFKRESIMNEMKSKRISQEKQGSKICGCLDEERGNEKQRQIYVSPSEVISKKTIEQQPSLKFCYK